MERAVSFRVDRSTPAWPCLLLLLALAAQSCPAEAPVPGEVAPDWRFVTGGRIRYAPAISDDGAIYCVSDDRRLRALSAAGRELWSVSLGSRPGSSPLVAADGSIYLVSSDRELSCFGPQGALRWSRGLDAQPVAAMALGADGSLYLPLPAGLMQAVDYRGRSRWSFRFKAEIASAPTVGLDGTIYVSTADRLFHALSPAGAEKWTLTLPANGSSAAVGSAGSLYVSAFGIHAFSPDGRPLWDLPVSSPTTEPVVGPDPSGASAELVAAASRDGRLHLADASGKRRSELDLGMELVSPPGFRPDGSIVIAGAAGLLRVLSAEASPKVALLRLKEPSAPPVLAADGLALVGSEDWVLYASAFGDSRGAPSGAGSGGYWLQSRRDGGRSARAARPSGGDSVGYLILGELASSSLPSLKESVLGELERHFDGRKYLSLGAPELERLLGTLALEGSVDTVTVGERGAVTDPVLRARACLLLGELGTAGSRRILLTVVEKDPRPEVQSIAAAALGRIGYDPDGQAARALVRVAARRWSDEAFLLVVVRSLAALAAAGGPTLGLGDPGSAPDAAELSSRPAWEALVAFTAGRYTARVREAALAALGELQAGSPR